MAKPRRRLISVTTIAIFGLAQLALFGLLSVGLVKQTLEASVASQRAETLSYETIDRLGQIFQLLQDTETGERGFVITGNPVFLEPYDEASARIGAELRYLKASPDAGLRRFGETIGQKLVFSAGTLEVRRRNGLAAAVDRVSGQQGKRLMNSVRLQLAEITGSERRLLALRSAERQRQQRRSEIIIYAVLVGAQLVSIGIGALLISYYRRRRDAERIARQRASLLRATLENVDTGIALLDEDGTIHDRNARLAELTETADDGATPLLDPRILAAARRREAVRFEEQVGDAMAIEVRGQPAPDKLYVVTYSDISDRQRSDRMKNEFISTVSHELRTPLTAIRGALGLLSGPLAKGLPPNAVSLLEIADRNAVRLTGLVNDLLDIDKIEAGRMRLELAPVDLNELARDAAEANRAFAVQRGIRMAVGCEAEPVIVRADAGRLHQVVTNLVSNAAKFSPEHGIVTITVERIGTSARVSVHDEGGGIPEEFKEHIFGKFAQAASGDAKRFGGSGLGLNISKAIVEQHGGAITFDSQPGATVFHFVMRIDDMVAAG